MKWIIPALALLLTATPASHASAQGKTEDAFAKAFFDPQLVLKHAQAIGLSTAQRRSIIEELKTAQTALAPLQVDMAEPALELQEMIEGTKVDEAKALAKIDAVLKIENEVKKRQAIFIIRVKNLLTPEQQNKLRALRDQESKDAGGDASALPDMRDLRDASSHAH